VRNIETKPHDAAVVWLQVRHILEVEAGPELTLDHARNVNGTPKVRI